MFLNKKNCAVNHYFRTLNDFKTYYSLQVSSSLLTNLKLKVKAELICETCSIIITMTIINLWITTNIMLLYILPMLSKVKVKNEINISTQISVDIFSDLNFSIVILDLDASAKKILYFKVYLTMQLRRFYLNFHCKWLICNIMTC